MDGAVVAVFRVEAEKLQARLAGSHAGVQKNRRHVKLALELAFDGSNSQKRMQCLKVSHQQQRVLLAFERLQGILEAYGPKWQSAFTPLVAGLVTDAADFWQVKTGVAFDVRNLEAETWFTQYMFTFADPITKTGEKELRSVIQLGVIEGWSIPQMQSHIELTFQKWMGQAATGHVVDPAFAALRLTSARSELIARTETTRAMAYGSRQLYKDAGITHKEWLATPDSHTRPSHHAADGQVTKIDEPFTVGGYLMMQPGDTAQGAPVDEIANCRCTVLPVLDDPNSIDESVVQPEPVDWWNEDDGDIEDWVDDEQPDGLPAWEDLPEGDDFEDAPLPPVYTPPPKPVPVLETPDDAPPAPLSSRGPDRRDRARPRRRPRSPRCRRQCGRGPHRARSAPRCAA